MYHRLVVQSNLDPETLESPIGVTQYTFADLGSQPRRLVSSGDSLITMEFVTVPKRYRSLGVSHLSQPRKYDTLGEEQVDQTQCAFGYKQQRCVGPRFCPKDEYL